MSQSDNNGKSSKHIFSIAIIIVVSYLIFFAISLIPAILKEIFTDQTSKMYVVCCNTTSSSAILINTNVTNPFAGVEKISSTFGPIVAGVVGYYFGNKPVDRMIHEIRKVEEHKDKFRNNLTNNARELNDTDEEIVQYKQVVEDQKFEINRLMKLVEKQKQANEVLTKILKVKSEQANKGVKNNG